MRKCLRARAAWRRGDSAAATDRGDARELRRRLDSKVDRQKEHQFPLLALPRAFLLIMKSGVRKATSASAAAAVVAVTVSSVAVSVAVSHAEAAEEEEEEHVEEHRACAGVHHPLAQDLRRNAVRGSHILTYRGTTLYVFLGYRV